MLQFNNSKALSKVPFKKLTLVRLPSKAGGEHWKNDTLWVKCPFNVYGWHCKEQWPLGIVGPTDGNF